MDTPNPELLALSKSTQKLTFRQAKQKPPQHRSGEKFLKGPIPFNWLCRAAQLSGKSFQVGVVIWFLAGLNKSATVRLGQSVLNEFGVDRHSKSRALAKLMNARLISIQCAAGCAPVITILPVVEDE